MLEDVRKSDPKLLAQLLKLSGQRTWLPHELGAVLRHQLSAPVQFDLGGLDEEAARKLRLLSEAQGLLLKSFSELLFHPNPPVELLELTKRYAKANQLSADSPLPRDVATVLYFAAIAAALIRCGRRITELDDRALSSGFDWATQQAWVDGTLRELLSVAARSLARESA